MDDTANDVTRGGGGPLTITFVKVLVPLLNVVPLNRGIQGTLHSLVIECFFIFPLDESQSLCKFGIHSTNIS